MSDFETVIGLEIHAQISTKSKLFCACDNDSFNKEPNTNVCPICMGFPGMLPVVNEEAIHKATVASLALRCDVPAHSKFDRKNYFYPDLPSGFQISQFDEPLALKGWVKIRVRGEEKIIRVTRLHVENDAGKLTHTEKYTLLDFNRAGTPLMEIVSEPDIRNPEEARLYAEEVQKILRYVGSSDCDMEKGMMRFDASVSIRPKGETNLYPRAEIKNLNSYRFLESAIEYEVKRQIELWENGNPLSTDQTVGWDEEAQITRLLREKESAADYRYFPEPDLPPVHVNEEMRTYWLKDLPELPQDKIQRFLTDYNLQEADAEFYSDHQELANYFESVAKTSKNPSLAHSFVSVILWGKLKEENLDIADSPIAAEDLANLLLMIDAGSISNNVAKGIVFETMWTEKKSPALIVEEQGLSQVSDQAEIESLCKLAIEKNPKIVEDIKSGKGKAIGNLVGFVMKESHGKANPKMVNDILSKLLL